MATGGWPPPSAAVVVLRLEVAASSSSTCERADSASSGRELTAILIVYRGDGPPPSCVARSAAVSRLRVAGVGCRGSGVGRRWCRRGG